MLDEAVLCVKCGCYANGSDLQNGVEAPAPEPSKERGVVTAAKVFMIIGTVIIALYTCLIGLAWCLPMTLSYFKKVKSGEPIGIGFKVCTLLFVSLISGILMLCDDQ